jgi:hypothetical protein
LGSTEFKPGIVKFLQNKPYTYNLIILPHDAAHKRQNDRNESIEDIINRLGNFTTVIVPKVSTLQQGLQITWANFGSVYFDEDRCKLGIYALDNYKKKRNIKGGWSDEPDKSNGCSEGADSFRTWAQAKAAGLIVEAGRTQQHDYGMDAAPDWRL